MNTVPFDTAKFRERLIKAKVEPKIAEAQSDVLFEALAQNVDKLATKEQLDVVRAELKELRAELKELRTDAVQAIDDLAADVKDFRKDMSKNKDIMLIWVTSLMLAGLSFVYFMMNNLVNNLPK